MAKYRVWAQSISYVYLDVEAVDEDQAMEIAREADGGDFHEDGGDWEFSDDITELDEDADVDYTYDEFFGRNNYGKIQSCG